MDSKAITDAEIDRLLELEAKIQDVWIYQENSDAYTHIIRLPDNQYICGFGQNADGKAETRARLAVAARNSIRSLADEVKRSRARIEAAPHASGCIHWRWVSASTNGDVGDGPHCNCWKSNPEPRVADTKGKQA